MVLSVEQQKEIVDELKLRIPDTKMDGNRKNLLVSQCPFCAHPKYKYGIYVGYENGRKHFGASNCFYCGKNFSTLEDTLYALGLEELLPKDVIELEEDTLPNELSFESDYDIDDELDEVEMPYGYKRVFSNDYLKSRGWMADDYVYFEVGTNRGVDQKYDDYVILPITDDGKRVGFVARHIWDKERIDEHNSKRRYQILRYKNSTENPFTKLLYNIDSVERGVTDTVILCEGVFDVVGIVRSLELYDYKRIVPVCTFGKKISETQMFKLQDKGVETVVIGYDNDSAGRSGTVRAASVLEKYFDVYVAEIPVECDKDFAEMSAKQVYDIFANHIVTVREFNLEDRI